MSETPHAELPAAQRHWRQTKSLTLVLLTAWLGITLLTGVIPEQLNQHTLFGFPLGFYLAAQGALLVYLALIGIHTAIMNRLDRRFASLSVAKSGNGRARQASCPVRASPIPAKPESPTT